MNPAMKVADHLARNPRSRPGEIAKATRLPTRVVTKALGELRSNGRVEVRQAKMDCRGREYQLRGP